MKQVNYLFEWMNGIYEPFNSIAEYDAYCKKYPNRSGILYTKNGYIVNTDVARELEKNDNSRKHNEKTS